MNKFFIIFIAFTFMMMSVSALSVVVHVPEKYTDVQAGDRFYFEIEVKYPENPKRKDLRLTYEILKDGELIAQSKVLKAIETQASFIDFIIIPETAENGLHIINVKISDYDVLSEEVSASFHVKSNRSDKVEVYFLLILVVIILIGILVVISIFVNKRQ